MKIEEQAVGDSAGKLVFQLATPQLDVLGKQIVDHPELALRVLKADRIDDRKFLGETHSQTEAGLWIHLAGDPRRIHREALDGKPLPEATFNQSGERAARVRDQLFGDNLLLLTGDSLELGDVLQSAPGDQ